MTGPTPLGTMTLRGLVRNWLAFGLDVVDQATGRAAEVVALQQGVPDEPAWRRDRTPGRSTLVRPRPAWMGDWRLLPAGTQVGRFRVLHGPGVRRPIVVLIGDLASRYVPRCLSVPFPTWANLQAEERAGVIPRARGWRVGLHPGPAYNPGSNVTGLRGTVLSASGSRLPWARVRATTTDGQSLGWAHADHRGEFLLVIGPARTPAPLRTRLDARITIGGAPIATGPVERPPLEVLSAAGAADDVAAGTTFPPAFRTRTVHHQLTLGRIVTPSTTFVAGP